MSGEPVTAKQLDEKIASILEGLEFQERLQKVIDAEPLLAQAVLRMAAGRCGPPVVHLICPRRVLADRWRSEHELPVKAVHLVDGANPQRLRGWDRLFLAELESVHGELGGPTVYDTIRYLESMGRVVRCTEEQLTVIAALWAVHQS